MFEIFKSKKVIHSIEEVAAKIKLDKKQTTQEVIDQIHNEFNCAGEALLKEAKEIIANSNFSSEKANKLKALGFKSVPEVVEIDQKEKKKALADKTVSLISHYLLRYPNYKFITEEMVSEICKKYNLVCGGVDLFKGFVPLKNTNEIAAFQLKDEDLPEFYIKRDIKGSHWEPTDITKDDMEDSYYSYLTRYDFTFCDHALLVNPYPQYTRICYGKRQNLTGLKICAPLKDMNTEGMDLNGYHLQKHIPDPVVLQPVKGGYLIVSAWGDEASDPLVVNHKMN